jgi:plastocyanin
MTSRRVAFVASCAVVLAACGGGGGGHSSTGAGCAAKAGVTSKVNDTGTKAASSSAITVNAADVQFSPTCTTSVPAGTVTLAVHNTGSLLHNVSIPDQHIDRDVAPGATVTIQLRVGTTPITYFCKYHRGGGMIGALIPA